MMVHQITQNLSLMGYKKNLSESHARQLQTSFVLKSRSRDDAITGLLSHVPTLPPPSLHLPPVAFTMSAVAVVGAVGATCDPGGGRTRGNIPARVGPLVLRPSVREDTANSAPREVIAHLISGEIIQRDLCPAYKLPL